MEQVPQGDVT